MGLYDLGYAAIVQHRSGMLLAILKKQLYPLSWRPPPLAKDAVLAEQSGQQDVERRERSTIQFPYNDPDDAVTIAKAVHENAGLSCMADQLAAYLNTSFA
jgi:hypothetical protein